MSILDSDFLNHTCTIKSRVQKRQLNFDNGTLTFQIGDIVIGTTSHATATVDKVSGTITGYLVLSTITGIFINDEAITSIHGTAVVNGVSILYVNEEKEPEYYWVTVSSVRCRFDFSNYNDNPEDDKHKYINEANPSKPLVYLPPTAIVERYTTTITTINTGFEGTYGVVDIKARCDESIVDHYEVLLTKEL